MNKIPFYGIDRMLNKQTDTIMEMFEHGIQNSIFINGKLTIQLEEKLGQYCSRKNAFLVLPTHCFLH